MEVRPVSTPASGFRGRPGPGHWPSATRRMTIGGATVRLTTSGVGPPLLLLNGIGGNIEMWEPVAGRLSDRRLIMLDLPGSGESPPLTVPLRMAGYARLLVRLLDQLNIDRVDVLGYSWGGALAQQLALTAPSRVRSLVLVATTPGLGGQPPAPWVIALMATPGRYYSRTYLRLVAPLVFGSDPAGADRASGEARRRRPPSLLGYAQQLYAISGWSSRPWLRRLRLPTLVINASRDPLVPPRNGRILSRAIAGARLLVFEGGHLFLLEQPDEPCWAINQFLDEQDVAAAGQAAGTRSRT
jgi:pimeloyl-ACP methyl ester carboxylesterase